MTRHWISRAAAGLALVVAIAACGEAPAPGPGLAVAVSELETPAGPGSGEPFVAAHGGDVYLSWLERSGDGHDLRFARFDGAAWHAGGVVVHGDDFFVNWADFPSLRTGPDGTLWAHWLQRGGQGTYDYGVRVARSHDGGATWSEPWTPHDDDSPTEHGFVSAFVDGDGMGFLWLDGRKADPAAPGGGVQEMTLRQRTMSSDGVPGEELVVDGRVCDCCQTAVTTTDAGPVAAYRNRTEDEIRDIYVSRRVDGAWTDGVPVFDDGWHIAACPVNGPAIDARGFAVAVAWFAAPGDVARVKVAFSPDAGASFGAPVVVDDGAPAGRVDVRMLEDGAALVTWLERTGGEGAAVRLRVVQPDGSASASHTLTESSSARASGFPRIAPLGAGDGAYLLAWTDVAETAPQVRVTRLEVERTR